MEAPDSSRIARVTQAPAARDAVLNANLFEIYDDQTSGVIHSTVQGFWSLEHTNAYFSALEIALKSVRGSGRRVRVLVDRRGSPMQCAEVAARMRKANIDLFKPEDRLAIVVDSSLLKIQMRRLFVHEGSQAFLSLNAALTWLTAH